MRQSFSGVEEHGTKNSITYFKKKMSEVFSPKHLKIERTADVIYN